MFAHIASNHVRKITFMGLLKLERAEHQGCAEKNRKLHIERLRGEGWGVNEMMTNEHLASRTFEKRNDGGGQWRLLRKRFSWREWMFCPEIWWWCGFKKEKMKPFSLFLLWWTCQKNNTCCLNYCCWVGSVWFFEQKCWTDLTCTLLFHPFVSNLASYRY